jgi:hypothetical protein
MERRRSLFNIGLKEEAILVDHADSGIHRSRDRPSALSLNWRRRRRRMRRKIRRPLELTNEITASSRVLIQTLIVA